MADYRLSIQTISRGKGRSVVAAAAYRAGVRLHEERTAEMHDYRRKEGVEHSEIIAPERAPEWATSREKMWNELDATETRSNARTAREFQLSLPHELSFEQRRELVRDFVKNELVAKGMVADVAMHEPGKDGDQRNYHAHILTTTRPLERNGFGAKNREWNQREQVTEWRKSWAEYQNRHLKQALGRQAPKVSHLSLAEQNVTREAQIHLGPHATAMERRGIKTNRGAHNNRIKQMRRMHRTRLEFRDMRDRLQHGVSPQGITPLVREMQKLSSSFAARAQAAEVELQKVMEAKKSARGLSVKQIQDQMIAPERKELREATAEYDAKKEAAGVRQPHKRVMAWLANPTKQAFRATARAVSLDRSAMRYELAKKNYDKMRYQLNTPWNKRRIETMVAETRQPLNELRRRERQLRQMAAQNKRWATRAAVVGKRMEVLHEAGVAVSVPMPKGGRDPQRFVRNAEQGFANTYRGLKPEIQQSLGKRLAQMLTPGRGLGVNR